MRNASRKQIAAEVIELGEMLFDTAIDAACNDLPRAKRLMHHFIEDMRVCGRGLVHRPEASFGDRAR